MRQVFAASATLLQETGPDPESLITANVKHFGAVDELSIEGFEP